MRTFRPRMKLTERVKGKHVLEMPTGRFAVLVSD